MEAFFFCVKDIVINWKSVRKPRYPTDQGGTKTDFSGEPQTLDCQEKLQ